MIKNKDILVRVGQELKEKCTEKANDLGLAVSAYVRMLIKKDLQD